MTLQEARRWHAMTPAELDEQVAMCIADSAHDERLGVIVDELRAWSKGARERYRAARAEGGEAAMLRAANYLADSLESSTAANIVARVRRRAVLEN